MLNWSLCLWGVLYLTGHILDVNYSVNTCFFQRAHLMSFFCFRTKIIPSLISRRQDIRVSILLKIAKTQALWHISGIRNPPPFPIFALSWTPIHSLRGLSFVIAFDNLKFLSLLCIWLQRSSSIMMHAISPITKASKRSAFLDAQLTDFALCSA